MAKLTIKDLDLKGKKLLMRVDFNVPLDDKQNITDDTRIKAALPTIKYAIEKGAKVILMSHLGRPKGKVAKEYSLSPAAKRLQKLLGKDVLMLDDCVGQKVKDAVSKMKEGDVIMLENLRFHPEEEKNDPDFAKELAGLADVYVNDAFGTAHRAHASTEGVTHHLKSAAGFLIQKEIDYLGKALENPEKPFVAILGGAKVSDKIPVIENLLDKVNTILIGGGMAYTFLKAEGKEIGNSKLESEMLDTAKNSMKKAKEKGVNILLPVDNIIAEKIDANAEAKECGDNVPAGWMGLDIGKKTVKEFESALKDAKTIVWNGPLGICEMDKFANGSKEIAEYISDLDATTIIGGGDTAAAVMKFGLEDKMSHISTGGGASLEFLEGKTLPGIAALTDK